MYAQNFGHQTVCLAKAIYYETRAVDLDESRAVGQVILNRTEQPKRFGNTPCEVVTQGNQFPWKNRTDLNEKDAWHRSLTYASELLNSELPDITNGAIYFFRFPDAWFQTMIRQNLIVESARFGLHRFWRE